MKKHFMKLASEETQKRILAGAVLVFFVLILVPLFWIAHYNFMCVDDFEYGLQSGAVWKETHSVFKVLIAQVSYAYNYYFKWQGTFFSEWLSTSLIGMLGEDAYYMGTYLSLGSFVLAEYWLFRTVFVRVLKADKYMSTVVILVCMSVQILTIPSPCEAFFWFCSAILYTFCLALAFCLVALWVLVYFDEGGSKFKKALLSFGILFLSIAVGGSNYVIGLAVLLLYFCCIVWFFYKKHLRKKFMLVAGMVYLVAFGLNVLAPGNSNRQDAIGQSMSPVMCILQSLKEAVIYIADNVAVLSIVLVLLFAPVFIKMVRKTDYRWPLPFLVTFLTFGIFAAQFAPTIFSMGNIGPGRVQNLYGLTFWIWLCGNELYWIGWGMRRYRMKESVVEAGAQRSYILLGWMVGAAFLAIGLLTWENSSISSHMALQSIRSGEAKAYYEEYKERLVLLQDPSINEVYVRPFSVRPHVLYFGDLSYDIHDWANETVAEYFGKEIVGYCE